MNARRVSVGTGEGAKGPAAACCERLVAYQAHGVQQEVLHHAPARSLRVTKQMGMRGFSAGSMGRNTVVSLGFVSYEMTTLK